MTQEQIIQGCKDRNPRFQRALVDTYASYMYGVCRRYISGREEAEDCLQESLVRVITYIDSFDGSGSFKAWIAKVTANQCLQSIRKNKKHLHLDLATSPEAAVEEGYHSRLELDDVLRFITTLPDKYRIAINMYVIEGFSHKEIAQLLSINESSSRSLVTRARRMIATHFSKEDNAGLGTLSRPTIKSKGI